MFFLDADCLYGNGRGYRGNVSTTKKGYTCQAWNSQWPHKHTINGSIYEEVRNSRNFCRNPGGYSLKGIWCYTTNMSLQWDYCDVPKCSNKSKWLTDLLLIIATRLTLQVSKCHLSIFKIERESNLLIDSLKFRNQVSIYLIKPGSLLQIVERQIIGFTETKSIPCLFFITTTPFYASNPHLRFITVTVISPCTFVSFLHFSFSPIKPTGRFQGS